MTIFQNRDKVKYHCKSSKYECITHIKFKGFSQKKSYKTEQVDYIIILKDRELNVHRNKILQYRAQKYYHCNDIYN